MTDWGLDIVTRIGAGFNRRPRKDRNLRQKNAWLGLERTWANPPGNQVQFYDSIKLGTLIPVPCVKADAVLLVRAALSVVACPYLTPPPHQP